MICFKASNQEVLRHLIMLLRDMGVKYGGPDWYSTSNHNVDGLYLCYFEKYYECKTPSMILFKEKPKEVTHTETITNYHIDYPKITVIGRGRIRLSHYKKIITYLLKHYSNN